MPDELSRPDWLETDANDSEDSDDWRGKDPLPRAEQLVAEVQAELQSPNGDLRRAEFLAGQLHEALLDHHRSQADVSEGLQEALAKFAEATGMEDAVEQIGDPTQPGPHDLPVEWSEGGMRLESVPSRLSKELEVLTAPYRVVVEPHTTYGHEWSMRFEKVIDERRDGN